MTSAVTFFTRQATIVGGRSNFSTTMTDSLTPPQRLGPEELDLPAYRESLRWLLNFTDAAIPWPSSILENFYVSYREMQQGIFGPLTHNFQSILAFPFWLFNANNYGNLELKEEDMVTSLPTAFYTHAAVARPYTKITFSHDMFVLFVSLQAIVMAFVWAVLL